MSSITGVRLTHYWLRERGAAAQKHERTCRHADQPREHLHRRFRSFDK